MITVCHFEPGSLQVNTAFVCLGGKFSFACPHHYPTHQVTRIWQHIHNYSLQPAATATLIIVHEN